MKLLSSEGATTPLVAVSNFAVQSHLSFRGLFLWLNPWAYASNMFAAPVLNVVLFALVARYATGEDPDAGLVLGVAMLAVPTMANGGILQSFTYERSFGTLSVLFVSPASRAAAYFSRGALHLPNALLAGVVSLAAAMVVLQLDVSEARWDAVLAALVLVGTSSVAFALAVGNFALWFRNWLVLYGASNGAVLALSGAVIPREELPALLRAVGEALPMTHGLEALRRAIGGATVVDLGGLLAAEVFVAGGYALVGIVIYRWIERRARREGALDD